MRNVLYKRDSLLLVVVLLAVLPLAYFVNRQDQIERKRQQQIELERVEQQLKSLNEWAAQVETGPPRFRIGDAAAGDYPTKRSLSEPENFLPLLEH